MDKEFPDGSTLICVMYEEIGEEPQPGDYVIVERVDRADKVEATCKRYHIDEFGKKWLNPESHDPRHKPIAAAGDRNIKEIRVIAMVIDKISRVRGRI